MANVDDDLAQLEKDIRQLKIEYEQYFGGGRPRPPTDVEWRIDQVIKRYGDRTAEIGFAQRFRYSNLAQTYAKYRDVFRKRMQQREEGTLQRHFGAAAKAVEGERARARAAQEAAHAKPEGVFAMACSDPAAESDKVERLYKAFREAKQGAGEDVKRLTRDSFQEFVRQKTEQLKSQKGCREVEYVIAVEGGHVKLKARVKK